MRKWLILLMVITGTYSLALAADTLDELDKIVSGHERFESVKRTEIEEAKAQYATAHTDSDRYNVLRNLYQLYRNFRIDSALLIADQRLAIARNMGLESKVASASINLAESYVKSGLPDDAIAILDTLDTSHLEDYHLKYRSSVYRNAYLLKASTALLPSDRLAAKEKLRELREEAFRNSKKDSRGYYTLEAERLLEAGMLKEAVAKMEEADRLFDFSKDAAMQYTMGEIYLAAGMREEAKEHLAQSAILDLSGGVKEYRSLILLSSLLFEDGDIRRASDYISVAFEDSHFSNSNLRTPEIMEIMPVIQKGLNAYEQREKTLTRTFLWIAGGLVVLLAIALFFLWRALNANSKMLLSIRDMNGRLEKRNKELQVADALKLQNINTLILSNARYISRLKDYRKSVYRLMKTGQYDKALDTLKSDKVDSKDISAFHEIFDESFLSMFPDFIARVNTLLKQPVELKEPGRLTPELRVIALMRLGLSSTEEIAGILHYSSQTVYNLRTSIRQLTNLPKEEFEAEIKKI